VRAALAGRTGALGTDEPVCQATSKSHERYPITPRSSNRHQVQRTIWIIKIYVRRGFGPFLCILIFPS
jgi:hypothetical protein